jgi:ceroid-lipofuscinosis MFS transporter 7
MLLNIATVGCFGAFETMGIHFAQSYFSLEPAVAGTVVSVNGMIGVCTLWSMGYLGKYFLDTQIIIGGVSVFAFGLLSYAWLKSVEMGAENSIVHYIFGVMMIYGIGYPIGVTALIGLFSKGEFRERAKNENSFCDFD